MASLTLADRTKLARLLALLGSEHQGERDSAGLAAHWIVQGAGTSWAHILQLVPEAGPQRRDGPHGSDEHDDLGLCLGRVAQLNKGDADFILRLATTKRRSATQRSRLAEIANTLRRDGRS